MSKMHLDADVMRIYRRLLSYGLPHWRRYALAMVGMAIYAFTQAAFAALIQPLLDKGFVLRDLHSIRFLPLEVVGLFLLRGIADLTAAYNINWVGRSII